MSGFSASWLSLREPADTAARDPGITALLADALRGCSPARFVDLGTGTGANFRFLSSRLGGSQEWLLVDSDPALLELLGRNTASLETRCIDLASGLGELPLTAGVVVTASALLDLVSDAWLAALIDRCYASRAIGLFALTYDGRMELEPPDVDDEWIRTLINRHQRRDKGFGDALGPDASERAMRRFGNVGYEVRSAPSDWRLGPGEAQLQKQLIEGWAHAAMELVPAELARIQDWAARRLVYVNAGASRMIVGHQDFVAWLP